MADRLCERVPSICVLNALAQTSCARPLAIDSLFGEFVRVAWMSELLFLVGDGQFVPENDGAPCFCS